MADTMSPSERSARMKLIRSKNTGPELAVRKLAHRLGYRFRLHRSDLPGKPDLVFAARRKVIFVHGCFWHRHPGCRVAHVPATRSDFWETKFAKTTERDARTIEATTARGWTALVVWECELRDLEKLAGVLSSFLGPPGADMRDKPGGGRVVDS